MTLRAGLAALLAVVSLVACSGGGGPESRPTQTVILQRLSTAIAAVNSTRSALLGDIGAVTAGAAALDAVDDLASTGNRKAVTPRMAAVTAAAAKSGRAVAALAARVTAYGAALTSLDDASTEVAGNRRATVIAVATAGRAEYQQAARFGGGARAHWPAYAQLLPLVQRWHVRARGGWYRSQQESANAYAVLTGEIRPAVEAARSGLEAADAARATASNRVASAITRARAELQELIG